MKENLIKELIFIKNKQLREQEEIVSSATAYKNESDFKSEGKYDTRAIEAGQLAGAQMARLEEIKRELLILAQIQNRIYPSKIIEIGSLFKARSNNSAKWYFLLPIRGGVDLIYGQMNIVTLSPESPMGQLLLHASCGDVIEQERGEQTFTYLIEEIC